MKPVSEKIKGNLDNYYQTRKDTYGENSNVVGWKDQKSQFDRFEQLVRVIKEESGFSINDLGCGLGDLTTFLDLSGFHGYSYSGYDHIDEMIIKAAAGHTSEAHSFYTIRHSAELKEADYTIASGIFNLKFETEEFEWLHYILETIHMMNAKSLKGFSFNCLTKYSDKEYMRPELYYSDPLFLFDYCRRNFSKNVALLHDYDQYDFTILIRK